MNQEIKDSGQRVGGIHIFQKSPQAMAFVQEWLSLAKTEAYHFLDDSPSVTQNDPCFREHRHDQSIFSVLTKIHGAVVIPDETYPPDEARAKAYPFLATRRR